MSVNVVLDKLSAHNDGVIGCLVTHGDQIHHNFADPYSLIDAETVGEETSQMFELMEALEDPNPEVSEVFLEMPNHSVFARKLDDGVLVVLNRPVDRRVFKRLKVGVNLFVKPLKRALDAPQAAATAAPVAPPSPAAPNPTADPSETAPPLAADAAEPAEPRRVKKRKRFYRGVEY